MRNKGRWLALMLTGSMMISPLSYTRTYAAENEQQYETNLQETVEVEEADTDKKQDESQIEDAGNVKEEALKRELVEELKIETEIGNYIETSIYEYPNVTVKLMAYFATVISGEIKLSVHDEAKWISISEVENFKFAPADIPFIEKLKEVL